MFPSGLALYWAVSTVIGIITQYFVMGGWGYLKSRPQSPSTPLKGT
jgi:membrane protein insertase Oxa1/YidC/SpoIIIJ